MSGNLFLGRSIIVYWQTVENCFPRDIAVSSNTFPPFISLGRSARDEHSLYGETLFEDQLDFPSPVLILPYFIAKDFQKLLQNQYYRAIKTHPQKS